MLSMRQDVLPPVPPPLETLDVSLQLLGQKVLPADGPPVAWRRELHSGRLAGALTPQQQVPHV